MPLHPAKWDIVTEYFTPEQEIEILKLARDTSENTAKSLASDSYIKNVTSLTAIAILLMVIIFILS